MKNTKLTLVTLLSINIILICALNVYYDSKELEEKAQLHKQYFKDIKILEDSKLVIYILNYFKLH